MTNLMPFIYGSTELRTFSIEGEPWFVAADVARLLEYRMASDMTRRLDEDDRGTRSVRTPSGDQQMTIISEAGFYAAILGSQCAGAKAIKRWLTHDVLPAIRKTGSFSVAELSRREILTMALEAEERADAEQRARVEAEQHARALEAPASAWSHLAESAGDYGVADAAKVLSRDPNITIGRDRLFKFMQGGGLDLPRHRHRIVEGVPDPGRPRPPDREARHAVPAPADRRDAHARADDPDHHQGLGRAAQAPRW